MRVADTIETETGAAQAGAANENARRTRAHGRALRHSAQVRFFRRVIPLAAGLGVLGIAGIVLYSPFAGSVPNVSIGPVSVSGTKVTMENPRLSGFRKGSQGYEVTADAALQDVRKPALIELQAMRGRLATDDKGGLAHLEAKGGLFDSSSETLSLKDDIRVWTDKGEEVRLKSADVAFKTGAIKSSETVTVTVPSGTLTADSLDVVENGKVISFVGNVHALFHGEGKQGPKKARETPQEMPQEMPQEKMPAVASKEAEERIRTSSAEAPEDRR